LLRLTSTVIESEFLATALTMMGAIKKIGGCQSIRCKVLSGIVLATIVGVLIEVLIIFMLLRICPQNSRVQMNLLTIIIIAIGLAMDAFAVSVATGATYKKSGSNHAFRMAFAFGGFQAIMPIVGWLAGLTLREFIKDYDHWVAFILLASIGGKMIYESFKIKHVQQQTDTLSTAMLLVLALATSVDALAVGITFSFLLAGSLAIAVIIIGLITFAFSYAGFYIGKSFGHFFESGIEALGGLILLAIGTKILLEHLFFPNI